jgi:hypothetical protein
MGRFILSAIFFLTLHIICFSCRNNGNINKLVIAKEDTVLRPVTIDADYVRSKEQGAVIIPKTAWAVMDLKEVLTPQVWKDTSLCFKILDTLLRNKNELVLVILGRYGKNCQVWLSQFNNNNNNATSAFPVYSEWDLEHFHNTKTIITGNTITIFDKCNDGKNKAEYKEVYKFKTGEMPEQVE